MDDKFIIENTEIEGIKIITPQRFNDERGFLTVSYNQKVLSDLLGVEFVQDKWTSSRKSVLRGIHFQEQHPQGKLVSVLSGKVLDVIVDFRQKSQTFGQYFSIILSASEAKMLYIPEGMGHGFLSLYDNSIFFYKTTDYFFPEHDRGILWSDKDLNINWQFSEFGMRKQILSNRDMELPTLKEYFKL